MLWRALISRRSSARFCGEQCERGELSDRERIDLADKLADVANRHLWRAHEFARAARSVRTGER
jgi:hypothetical protein